MEELTATVARRLTDRLTAASEKRGDYLDPNLAALLEALHWSRETPPGARERPARNLEAARKPRYTPSAFTPRAENGLGGR